MVNILKKLSSFPYQIYNILRFIFGFLFFQRDFKKNTYLKKRFLNQDLYIFGNGPSIRKISIDKIKSLKKVFVNKFYLSSKLKKIVPEFYFAFDPLLFQGNQEFLKYLISLNENNKTLIFLPINQKKLVSKYINVKSSKVYFIDSSMFLFEKISYVNLALPTYGFKNIVQYSIYSAFYMGFKNIFLLGSETTGYRNIEINNSNYRILTKFLYSYSFSKKEFISFQKNKIFQRSDIMFLGFYHIFKDYYLLSKYAQKIKVNISNLTPVSSLDMFDFNKTDLYE